MKTEKTNEAKPPYVSYKTFTNTIASLRESGLPDRLDRTVFPGFSGTVQVFLLASFRFLGLTANDGVPTATLKDLINHPENEKTIFAKIIKEKYAFLFNGNFNINSASTGQVTEKFRETGLGGSTIIKSISFFTNLCEDAGVQISPHLKSAARSVRTPSNGPVRRAKKRKDADEPENEIPPPPIQLQAKSLNELLLEKFPTFDPKWDAETAKKWFENFAELMKATAKTPPAV
jgi:hypothetical protein